MNNLEQLTTISHNLRLFCESTLVPCISPNTEIYLLKLLEQHKPKRILEIGTACWYSLFTMAKTIQAWWWTIIWCERAYPNRVEINKLLSLSKQYRLDNIQCLYWPFLAIDPKVLQSDSVTMQQWGIEALKHCGIETVFDFVFIDAQKSEYPLYIDYLVQHKLINDQTILLFDDVIKYQDKMPWLTEKLEELGYSYQIKQLELDDGVLLAWQQSLLWLQ